MNFDIDLKFSEKRGKQRRELRENIKYKEAIIYIANEVHKAHEDSVVDIVNEASDKYDLPFWAEWSNSDPEIQAEDK